MSLKHLKQSANLCFVMNILWCHHLNILIFNLLEIIGILLLFSFINLWFLCWAIENSNFNKRIAALIGWHKKEIFLIIIQFNCLLKLWHLLQLMRRHPQSIWTLFKTHPTNSAFQLTYHGIKQVSLSKCWAGKLPWYKTS